jgi:hypothetical protein
MAQMGDLLVDGLELLRLLLEQLANPVQFLGNGRALGGGILFRSRGEEGEASGQEGGQR